jgi:sortase A
VTLARILGAIGRTLITAGVLILLFVAYQLWGTGISQRRSQHDLKNQFAATLATASSTSSSTTSTTGSADTVATAPPSTVAAEPVSVGEGEALGRIVIPKLHLDAIVVQGVNLGDLKRGPGHYPDTPLPGQAGNAAIAGHRTTYGAPFGNVDQLEAGDEILVTTVQGSFTYEVLPGEDGKRVVSPSAVEVLKDQGDNRLTLTSCEPKYSASKRIIISARLKGSPLAADATTGTVAAGHSTLGLSGETAPRLPAVLWGLLAAAIWLGSWLIGRRWRKWPSYAIALPIFLVVLFVFFENFARLLPANY